MDAEAANRIRNVLGNVGFTLHGEILALLSEHEAWDLELHGLARQCLAERLSGYAWPAAGSAAFEQDLGALLQLRETAGGALVDEAVLCAVLQAERFVAPPGGGLLRLLRSFVASAVGTVASADVAAAARAWTDRLFRAAEEERSHRPNRRDGRGDFGKELVRRVAWWTALVDRLDKDADHFAAELAWLLEEDLSGACLGVHYAESLALLPDLPDELVERPGLPLQVFGDVFRKHPPGVAATFEALFPNRRFLSVKQQALMPRWHRVLMRDLVVVAAEALVDAVRPSEHGLEELLYQKATPAMRFLTWAALFPAAPKGDDPTVWQRVRVLAQQLARPFRHAAAQVAARSCSVLVVLRCAQVSQEDMRAMWAALRLPQTQRSLTLLEREVAAARTKLEQLQRIAAKLLPATPAAAALEALHREWQAWPVQPLFDYLRMAPAAPAALAPPAATPALFPPPLPPLLLDAFFWLRTLLESKLFLRVWAEQAPLEGLARLEPAAAAWARLFATLGDGTVRFSRLAQLSDLLVLGTERSLLSRTAAGAAARAGDAERWAVQSAPDRSWMTATGEQVERWCHLHAVHATMARMQQCLDHVGCYLKKQASLESVRTSIRQLQDFFQAHPFDACCLADYPKCHAAASNIHASLTQLEPSVLAAAEECPELLLWLRQMPADSEDFSGVLQIAMSRNEMECPVDLWKVEAGKPGRPDEEKLSMLKTVHSQLHKLIYREHLQFSSFQALVKNALADMTGADAQTTECIRTSQHFLVSLQELMGSGSSSMAQDRIVQLQAPEKHSTWLCTTRPVGGKRSAEPGRLGDVFLQWSTVRMGQDGLRYQNRKELLDFQSNAVLGATEEARSDVHAAAVEAFISQFSWMRELHDILCLLNEFGHFDYFSFHYEFSMQDDARAIRDLVYAKREELEQWQREVRGLREANYFLNFFSMKQLWALVTLLDALPGAAAPDAAQEAAACRLFRSIHAGIAPDAASHLCLASRIAAMRAVWAEGRGEGDQARATLELCARALHAAFAEVPVRWRGVQVPHISAYSTGTNFSTGVHVVCCKEEEVTSYTVAAYAHLGYVPEWQEVLVCCEATTWEAVYTLLLRWKHAAAHGRGGRMYCLAAVHRLPFELQRKAVAVVREARGQVPNALFVVSGEENEHIVAQLAHFRVKMERIPDEVLRAFGLHISASYYRGVAVYLAASAGAGKTFQVHRAAAHRGSSVVHVPVTDSQSLFRRLEAVGRAAPAAAGVTLHLDVMDTSDAQLNKYLFELVFLGGVHLLPRASSKRAGEEQYFWLEAAHSVCIEVAAGQLLRRLPVCALLEQRECTVTAETFCTDEMVLRSGMGASFYTARTDGTIVDKDSELQKPATAFERLRYVCVALDTLEHTGGRFPYHFDGTPDPATASPTLLEDGLLAPGRCLELLLDASRLGRSSPSLWCLWSFVNVMYWQIRGIQEDSSPINSACMPDESSDRKDETTIKEKYKGEVVKFLINTAREFATRQTKPVYDPEEVLQVDGREMTRWEWKGDWKKQPFQCDGQPVFRRGGFYMYFRGLQRQWVIDDGVYPTGPVFSKSETDDLEGTWSTNATWEVNRTLKVTKTRDRKGYNGEALKVSGCTGMEKGASLSAKEDGIYLLQPPEDQIEGKPHYVMIKTMRGEPEPIHRHIFFAREENTYALCPVCTMDQGAHALCVKPDRIDGDWKSIPPNHRENPHLKLVRRKDDPAPARGLGRARAGAGGFAAAAQAAIRAAPGASGATNLLGGGQEGEGEAVEKTAEQKEMEEMVDTTLRWNESNHECLLFSNVTHVVSFLSLDPKRMQESMHPGLKAYLLKNRINIGEDLNRLNERHHQVLSSLTEVQRTREEADSLMKGGYCLTGDSLLKMLAIFVRVRCGIPVVLMGECGCGKTMLIRYLCRWLGVTLLVLDINGGTREKEIVDVFRKAEKALKAHDVGDVYVFLDEINTCKHMGLITEIMVHRSIHGTPLRDGIQVLGALNPYRFREDTEDTPGLVFQGAGKGGKAGAFDPMTRLVYRVHPIPQSLRDFIFDFGSLSRATERLYIQSMTAAQLARLKLEKDVTDFIADLILEAQCYVRAVVNDVSATSLRDVNRCLGLLKWFHKYVKSSQKTKSSKSSRKGKDAKASPAAAAAAAQSSNLETATVLALAFVYYYRLSKHSQRIKLWEKLQDSRDVKWSSKGVRATGFPSLRGKNEFEQRLNKVQTTFCTNIVIKEEGIAMNNALMENLFVLIISILNKIPVFLVGKPGSSKTLALQVIQSNLQGKRSMNAFWRKYPAVYIFQYQCSPMSDSGSIQHQFDMAVRYQKHAQDTITVLLLDEVGLAEHSPEMPLKVLHGMLVNPKIAIVGLSNWVLDPAKMNRAILLQRTEPTEDDIQFTGECIMTEQEQQLTRSQDLQQWLAPLARAYHEVYVGQRGRDFVGMRDYYNLVKLLRSEMRRTKSGFEPNLLAFSLCRNFGGKPELMAKILERFMQHCFNKSVEQAIGGPPSALALIRANLADPSARHLMVLTRNGAALSILFGCGILDPKRTATLIGSDFQDDNTELHLIQQINQVKQAMATGSTIVLLNHDNIYEALYDVLNQRYVINTDAATGVDVRMLRLAIGSRSQLCKVENGFKIVVIVEQDHAYRSLDLPLLNRFEKQVLCPTDVLAPRHREAVKEIEAWLDTIMDESHAESRQQVVCGYHTGTVASAVLVASLYDEANVSAATVETVKRQLLFIALPVVVSASPSLQALDEPYFRDLADLQTAISRRVLPASDGTGTLAIVFTHSPASHLDDAPLALLEESAATKGMADAVEVVHLQLAELDSERQLTDIFDGFLADGAAGAKLLVVQCDPIVCRQPLIDHARYLFVRSRSRHSPPAAGRGARHVVFLIHLPLGVRDRKRYYSLDFNLPWTYLFVDDIRVSNTETALSTKEMLQYSAFELCTQCGDRLSIDAVFDRKFQLALAMCTVPYVDSAVGTYSYRLQALQALVELEPFRALFRRLVLRVLERDSDFRESSRGGHHRHVAHIKEEALGGSLRQSLAIALEVVLVRAMAAVLQYLDRDFNLAHLVDARNHGLWFAMAATDAVLRLDSLVAAARLADSAFQVENHGRACPVIGRFPFSHKLTSLLDADHRAQVEGHPYAEQRATLRSVCDVLFGADLQAQWDAWAGGAHHAYLHDVVGFTSPCFEGLSTDDKVRVYTCVATATDAASLASLGAVHAALWYNEYRLFNYCSLLATVPAAAHGLLVRLEQAAHAEAAAGTEDVAEEEVRRRLARLDAAFLQALLAALAERVDAACDAFDASASMRAWEDLLADLANVASFLGNLLLDLDRTVRAHGGVDAADEAAIWRAWVGLDATSVFVQELVLPSAGAVAGPAVRRMLEVASAQQPSVHSAASLASVLQLVAAAPAASEHVSSFLRRHVRRTVLGRAHRRHGYAGLPEDDVVAALVAVLNGLEAPGLPASAVFNLPFKRSLVQNFAELQAEGGGTAFVASAEAAQLYLQHLQDVAAAAPPAPPAAARVAAAAARQVLEAGMALPPPCQAVAYVQAVHVLQQALDHYAAGLVEAGAACGTVRLDVDLEKALVRQLDVAGSPPAVEHLLKLVRHRGGPAAVAHLVVANAQLPWLPMRGDPAAAGAISSEVDSVPDPFVWLGAAKAYEGLCEAVRTAAPEGASVEPLSAFLASDGIAAAGASEPERERTARSLVIAATFSQFVVDHQGLFERASKERHALAQWLRDWATRSAAKDELPYYFWLAAGCPRLPTATRREQMHAQLGANVLIVALAKRRSWLHALLFYVQEARKSLLPSMPNDPFTVAFRALPGLGWYKCPNGHLYSVGECTMPMQLARCQECGVPIGGQNHVSVRGVSRVDAKNVENVRALPGYTLKAPDEPSGRLSTLTERLFRYLIHSAMHVAFSVTAAETSGALAEAELTQLVFEQSEVKEDGRSFAKARALVQARLDADWEALAGMLQLDDRDLAVALHLVLRRWLEGSVLSIEHFVDGSARCRYENEFNAKVIEPVLGARLQANLAAANEGLSESGAVVTARACLGDDTWARVHEVDAWPGPAPRGDTELLWRYRRAAAFAHFQRSFSLCHSNQEAFPVLAAFLAQEDELACMHHLADVLAFHALAFQALPPGSLSREEAAACTHRDLLARLPAAAQAEATEVLHAHMAAFNAELPRVELFQCKDNPFITAFPNGAVDLSGARQAPSPMGPDSPLRFSLPSMLPSEMDVYGACTIQVIALLQNRHNGVLDKLRAHTALGVRDDDDDADEGRSIPPISYLTPPEVVRHHIISYSREEHLLPLLQVFARQSLAYGGGRELEFDLAEIERGLVHTVLAGKRPIAVHTRHFQYAGEAKASGSLMELRVRVAQAQLPEAVLQAIIEELDNQLRLKQLLRMLELVVQFVVSIGDRSVRSIDGSTKLQDFVLSAQLLSEEDWREASTPAIGQHVRLEHLQQLFGFLEERMHGNPLDRVPEAYRAPLDEAQAAELRRQARYFDLDALLAAMQRFLVERLASGETEFYQPAYSLFDSLDDSVIAPDDEEWFAHFPESLTLAHTFAAFDLLREFAGR